MTTTATVTERQIDFTKSEILQAADGQIILSIPNTYNTINAGRFSATFLLRDGLVGTIKEDCNPSNWSVIETLVTMTFQND